jgi:tetratricopeptide (TPR) repeat protein
VEPDPIDRVVEYFIDAMGVKSIPARKLHAIHIATSQTHSIQSTAFDRFWKFPPGAYGMPTLVKNTEHHAQVPFVTRRPAVSRRLLLSIFLSGIATLTGCQLGAKSQNSRGVAMYQQGRYAEALQYFEQAKVTDAANPDTYYNLASAYHKLGTASKDPKMIDNAERMYNTCLEMSPNHVDCYRGLSILLVDKGQPEKGFTLLKDWAIKNPGLSEPRVELARLHQEFNQNKVAEQYLNEAIAMDPNNPRAWAAKGRSREISGDLMMAVQNYETSLALNASQPELYQRIGALKVRLSQNIPVNPTATPTTTR